MKRYAKVAMVNLGILLAGLLVMELIFGSWVKPQNKLNQLNLLRDVHHQFDVSHLYKGEKNVITYTRDKYGFRTSAPNQPQKFDIVTIGGSTTEQRYISDEDTWQQVLERQLAASGKHMVVANAGIDGQSTFGHLKNFEWWFPQVPGLKPKYYLFYIGINDLYADEISAYDQKDSTSTGSPAGWKKYVADNSALLALVRRLRGWHMARQVRGVDHRHIDFDTVHYTTRPMNTDYQSIMEQRLLKFASRIQTLISQAQEAGSKPIFVTQPVYMYRYRTDSLYGVAEFTMHRGVAVNGVDYYYMKRLLDSTLQATCAAKGVACINLAESLPCTSADFYDFYHMTPQGARKTGEALFATLRALPNF